jgi:hypothetical protein
VKNLEKWIANYIVELNLCPFAANTLQKKKWKSVLLDFKDATKIEETFYSFLKENLEENETYFLYGSQLEKWEDFLFYFNFLEDLTRQIFNFEQVKIVGFHPEYIHGEVTEEYIHYSNRAPWPLIQLLRTEDVEKRSQFIDVNDILDANAITLKEIPVKELNKKLNDCK